MNELEIVRQFHIVITTIHTVWGKIWINKGTIVVGASPFIRINTKLDKQRNRTYLNT